MIKAVLDTNVLISSIFWRGSPYQVVKKGIKNEYRIVSSVSILEELTEKLRNKFEVPENKIATLMDIILIYAEIVDQSVEVSVVERDPSDNKIFECALGGDADYIVSGDSHLLEIEEYKGIEIISPKTFLKKLEERE